MTVSPVSDREQGNGHEEQDDDMEEGGSSLEEPLFEEGQEFSEEDDDDANEWLDRMERTPEQEEEQAESEVPAVPEVHGGVRPVRRRQGLRRRGGPAPGRARAIVRPATKA